MHHSLLEMPILFFILLSLTNCSLYYEIKPKRQRCYKEFVLQNYVMIIKWKIFSLEASTTTEELNEALKNIKINVYDDDTTELVFDHSPKEFKDKTSWNSKKNGQVLICTSVNANYQNKIKDIYINVKLYSGLSEHRIHEAVKKESVDKIETEVYGLVSKIYPIIEKQKDELKMENQSAKETIEYIKWYKSLTIIQIIICFFVGVVQVFNFKRFLKSSLMI